MAYGSRSLNEYERNYCAARLEMLALVTYVDHFRYYYLAGCKFLLGTDHHSLKWLMSFREPEVTLHNSSNIREPEATLHNSSNDFKNATSRWSIGLASHIVTRMQCLESRGVSMLTVHLAAKLGYCEQGFLRWHTTTPKRKRT